MNEIDIKSKIIEIVGRHITDGEFKVYLLGLCKKTGIFGDQVYDVGILTNNVLSYNTLSEIEWEFETLPSERKIYLIDVGRIDQRLKTMALNTGELLN